MQARGDRGISRMDVAVLLGLLVSLAAFALPAFSPVEKRSREAELTILAGSLRSAAASAHGLALATRALEHGGSLQMRGQGVELVNGYPDRPGIAGLLSSHGGFHFDSTSGTFSHLEAPLPGACAVTYHEASSDGLPPKIAVVSSGC